MSITARRIITIRQNIQATPEFDVAINTVNFVPDEVIVRVVSVSAGAFAAPLLFSIYSDLFNDTFIAASASPNSGMNIFPNTSWIPRGGNGIWRFTCLNGVPTTMVFSNATLLYMQLEFIKH